MNRICQLAIQLSITSMLLLFSATTVASEICYSPALAFSEYAPPTHVTLFNCPTLGVKTLPQLAALGFAVVSISSVTVSGSSISDQLILRRPELILRSGFEA